MANHPIDRLDGAALWAYLTEHSGLPGPRANLTLMHEFARSASRKNILAASESGDDYIRCCGIVGLGVILGAGHEKGILARLTVFTTSDSWRVREAVAMAVQAVGDADASSARTIVAGWADSSHPLTLRAAAGGICEPRLLKDPESASLARRVCERATEWIATSPSGTRRDPDVRTLRQALGYCWSVAVAADPAGALEAFLALESSSDVDVRWIVRENKKKTRLRKVLES